MKKLLIWLVILLLAWHFYKRSDHVSLGPGVMVREEPRQEKIYTAVNHTVDNYTVTELARFEITAKVLSRTNYRFDREADLAPVDLALGWGKMSDESVLEHIQISQSGRFYRWQVKEFPIPRREIETQSANMHLIPASDLVKRDIDRVRKGDIIKIAGSLVSVASTTDNWHWKSSLTRQDTGKGACELIWVENLSVVTP